MPEPELRGTIKSIPEDFVVEEIPAYEPEGRGDFLFLKIHRRGMNTRDVIRSLADALQLGENDIGYAGLKDRQAECTQTFSFPLHCPPLSGSGTMDRNSQQLGHIKNHAGLVEKALHLVSHCEGLSVREHGLHPHSLRRGHLKGNRFQILIRCPDAGQTGDEMQGKQDLLDSGTGRPASESLVPEELRHDLEKRAHQLREKGMPNLFGAQRFGDDQSTLKQGFQFMDGRKARRWMLELGMSAVQSYTFNHYLALRARAGALYDLMDGDLAVKLESGGIFKVPVAEAERHRLLNKEISYTGPMFGKKMRSPEGPSAELEKEALGICGREAGDFSAMKVPGARRAGLVFPEDLKLEWKQEGLLLDFFLPAGSYATVFLSHLVQLTQESRVPDLDSGT